MDKGSLFFPPLPVENLLCFFWSHLSFGLRSMCVVLKAGYHIPSCSSSSIMCVTVRHSYFPWSLSVRSNGRHVGKDTGGMTGYIDYHVFLVMCHALSVIGLVRVCGMWKYNLVFNVCVVVVIGSKCCVLKIPDVGRLY
ncbi:hypothetical protein M432DRAFT_239688 [Thermoascus aurantiacus ATCC 26904]